MVPARRREVPPLTFCTPSSSATAATPKRRGGAPPDSEEERDTKRSKTDARRLNENLLMIMVDLEQ